MKKNPCVANDGDLVPAPPASSSSSSSSSQECNASGDTSSSGKDGSCESSSHSSQMEMIDKMKRDMEHLQRKAMAAISEQERNARLSLVHEMEKQLKLMAMNQ